MLLIHRECPAPDSTSGARRWGEIVVRLYYLSSQAFVQDWLRYKQSVYYYIYFVTDFTIATPAR